MGWCWKTFSHMWYICIHFIYYYGFGLYINQNDLGFIFLIKILIEYVQFFQCVDKTFCNVLECWLNKKKISTLNIIWHLKMAYTYWLLWLFDIFGIFYFENKNNHSDDSHTLQATQKQITFAPPWLNFHIIFLHI